MFICLDNKVKQYNLNYKKNILKYIWNILKHNISLWYKFKTYGNKSQRKNGCYHGVP